MNGYLGAQPIAVGDRVRLRTREAPHAVSEAEWYEIIATSDHDFSAVRFINGRPFGTTRYGIAYDAIIAWQPPRPFDLLEL